MERAKARDLERRREQVKRRADREAAEQIAEQRAAQQLMLMEEEGNARAEKRRAQQEVGRRAIRTARSPFPSLAPRLSSLRGGAASLRARLG